MIRLKLLLAYDGRPFRGWQSQASGDAVQDHLERAFAEIVGRRVVVHGSGRTDAGVHALGQVAHVDVPNDQLSPDRWLGALNARLRQEVRVLKVMRVPATFHARFGTRGKVYTYRIWNASVLRPLEIGRVWHMPSRIDRQLLRVTATHFVGTHDFASFAANRRQVERTTLRTIHRVSVATRGPLITLRFEGDGFLYRMVRLLTGTLIRCAQGRAEPSWVKDLLAAKGSPKTSFAAPAEGLYLARVLY